MAIDHLVHQIARRVPYFANMARKKIREYSSKQLLKAHLARLSGTDLPIQAVQVTSDTNFRELAEQNVWLRSTKLVVKPDMLFGKRGKHDLLGLNLSITEVCFTPAAPAHTLDQLCVMMSHLQVEDFVRKRMDKKIEVDGCAGTVNTFIVEPFVPHDQEFYLSITSQRMSNQIAFSEQGGVEIEENWCEMHCTCCPANMQQTAHKCSYSLRC